MKRVSLKDIADALGVSKATVSLVLSGKAKNKRVSDELCALVKKTADEMNYHPNELARGLRTGSTKTIGVIVADISNEFFGKLVYCIQQRANHYGYAVVIINSDEGASDLSRMINFVINKRVDSFIMVPSPNYSSVLIENMNEYAIPFVQVDRFIEGYDSSYVVLDNYRVSADVTEMLINQGCKRIAMFRHKTSIINGRLEGYVDAMKQHGLYDSELVINIDYNSEQTDTVNAINELYADNKTVDAVFFQSHELFLHGIRQFKALGIDLSKDLKIACFDKIDAYAFINFPLIYVAQPISEMGNLAVDILIKQLENPEYRESVILKGMIEKI